MRETQGGRACPFFNLNDHRCSSRFTLERMAEVFQFCLGEHRRCEVYHELTVRGQLLQRPPLAQAG